MGVLVVCAIRCLVRRQEVRSFDMTQVHQIPRGSAYAMKEKLLHCMYR